MITTAETPTPGFSNLSPSVHGTDQGSHEHHRHRNNQEHSGQHDEHGKKHDAHQMATTHSGHHGHSSHSNNLHNDHSPHRGLNHSPHCGRNHPHSDQRHDPKDPTHSHHSNTQDGWTRGVKSSQTETVDSYINPDGLRSDPPCKCHGRSMHIDCRCDCHVAHRMPARAESESITCADCRQVCRVICPPIPSHIVTMLAFHPPTPSYKFVQKQETKVSTNRLHNFLRYLTCGRHLLRPTFKSSYNLDLFNTQLDFEIGDKIVSFKIVSNHGNDLACVYIDCHGRNARYTVLYSHGNAEDVGLVLDYFIQICRMLKVNALCYDYSGYGESTGGVSENNIYKDIMSVYDVMVNSDELSVALRRPVFQPNEIIAWGFSIGTAPTIDLAAQVINLAGVVLQAPLTSGLRVLFPNRAHKRTSCLDPFPSIDKVSMIQSPVLVIHGTGDTVIGIQHGLQIYQKCAVAVAPLWLSDCDHDVWSSSNYLLVIQRLNEFIHVELPHMHKAISTVSFKSLNLQKSDTNIKSAHSSKSHITHRSSAHDNATPNVPHSIQSGHANNEPSHTVSAAAVKSATS